MPQEQTLQKKGGEGRELPRPSAIPGFTRSVSKDDVQMSLETVKTAGPG
jgi:hypothetical protein